MNLYELHYREEDQARIENYQIENYYKIVKIVHDVQDKLDKHDFKDFVVMVKEYLEEEE